MKYWVAAAAERDEMRPALAPGSFPQPVCAGAAAREPREAHPAGRGLVGEEMLLPADERERRVVRPAARPGVAHDVRRVGAVGREPDDVHVSRAWLRDELEALPVLRELEKRVTRAVAAQQLLAVAIGVVRALVPHVGVDELAVERDPHRRAVLDLVVVDVHVLVVGVVDPAVPRPTDLLALGDEVALRELRRDLFEVDVVGRPAVAVVEEDAVLAVRRRVRPVDDAVSRREHGLAGADVVAVLVALREVDGVLLPVPVPLVGRRLPDLSARDGHLEERPRPCGVPRRAHHEDPDRSECDEQRSSCLP